MKTQNQHHLAVCGFPREEADIARYSGARKVRSHAENGNLSHAISSLDILIEKVDHVPLQLIGWQGLINQ